MSRKKIFGALFVVAVLVLAVLSSTVRSKVSLADERKYEELPQQENIYLSANKEQPQDAIEYQPMDSIELSSELELSPLGLPSDFHRRRSKFTKLSCRIFMICRKRSNSLAISRRQSALLKCCAGHIPRWNVFGCPSCNGCTQRRKTERLSAL